MSFKRTAALLAVTLTLPIYFNACSPSKSPTSDTAGNNGGNGTAGYTCSSTPVAKGSRQFGMDILDEPSSGGSYNTSLQYLKDSGGSFQTFHVNWSDIEGAGSGATSGSFTDPFNGLASLAAVAAASGTKVTLRIHPVDVPGKYVPSDLSATRFNSANMATRYQKMLTFVFSKISPSLVSHLVIGNEIDGYNPGSDTNFWFDYPAFLFNVKVWLANNHPTVKIGFVATMSGITGNPILPNSGNQTVQTIFGAWLNSVDLLGVTYYPLTSQFTLKPNSEVAAQFQSLTAFSTKPIHIEEVGYPTSSQNGGSENLQSEFYCEVFKAWDRYPTQIESLAILRMIDTTRAGAESTATRYGFTGNESFIEYIRTLGIRTNANGAKNSFNLVKEELKKRSF